MFDFIKMYFSEFLLLCLALLQLIAMIVTVYDKNCAKRGRRRIKERTLFTVAFFGGACVMYITMLIIRHKTKHFKFMFFLPLMIIFHIILLYYIFK